MKLKTGDTVMVMSWDERDVRQATTGIGEVVDWSESMLWVRLSYERPRCYRFKRSGQGYTRIITDVDGNTVYADEIKENDPSLYARPLI